MNFHDLQTGFTFLVLSLWYQLTRAVPDKVEGGHKMVVLVVVVQDLLV